MNSQSKCSTDRLARVDRWKKWIDLLKAHRPQIAPTVPLERVNAEINRRTDVVGIVPNDLAIVGLIGELSIHRNDEWQIKRRYSHSNCRATIESKWPRALDPRVFTGGGV